MTYHGPPVRRTRHISWAPSGWLVSDTTTAIDTDFVTLTCADDFVAIRVGFANVNPAPYPVSKVIAAASSTLGDHANPTGNTGWTPLTFAHNGADIDAIVTAPGAPTAIAAVGNSADPATGHTGIPRWTWTDWTPLRSLPRTDVPDAPRVVMIRVLLPALCTYTRPNGGFLDYHRYSAMNQGFAYVAGHVPLDVVTDPRPINAAAAGLGHSKSPVSCVQFLTHNAGIVGMITGDSHHQGTSTTTQFWNCLMRATVSLGVRYLGRIPFGYWSTAQGGADSQWFFASLANVLPIARPGFVVLPGWTYNETTGAVHADQAANDIFFARLMATVETCNSQGAIPILLTPFPRDPAAMTPTQTGPWRKLRDSIIALRETGAMVLDATPLLGRQSAGQLDGTYLPDYTDDQMHPNDAGHAVLAGELTPIIERICRLARVE
jgi:hypothetical protein